MHIKSTLIALSLALLTGWLGSIILSDTAFASPSDGKTCLLTPFGGLERCPYGAGINDLSTAGYVLVPSGSQCFKGDEDLGEDTPNKFACDFNSPTERDSVQVFANWTAIRDKAITDWKKANPGKGDPTEGQIYTFINTNVYAELTPQEEDIINQDCSQLTGINKTKCEAVKACVENDPDGNITKCTDAWATCMDGSTDTSKANECAEQVSALGAGGADSTCDIDGGLGWILCPLLNTMAKINDAAWFAIEGFLKTPYINTDTRDSSNGVYVAWSLIRNMANAAFVIVFLYIIFSQVSSIGVSNYGIKKMLPKIIIGAILVNTSFWIAALLVDISNVLGSSVYNMFRGIADQIPVAGSTSPLDNLTWVGVTATALVIAGSTVGVWLKVAVLAPLAFGAIISLIGILVTLTLRHAIVVVLIVAAPLAFVAYLLPNTERLFKMWWGLLKILLLIYPVIAFVFAVAHIAQRVVLNQALDSDDVLLQIFAVAIPAISIMLIPTLIKMTGGVLSRFGVNNPFGGAISSVRTGIANRGKLFDNESAAARLSGNVGKNPLRWMSATGAKKNARRGARNSAAERNRKMAEAKYVADEISEEKGNLQHRLLGDTRLGRALGATDNKMATELSVGMGEAGKQAAIGTALETQAKFEAEEVTAQNAIIKSLNLTNEQQAALASGRQISYDRTDSKGNTTTHTLGGNGASDLALRMAAQQNIARSGDAELINHVLNSRMSSLSSTDVSDAKELAGFADTLASSANKPAYIQAGDIEDIRNRGKAVVDPSTGRVKTDSTGKPIIAGATAPGDTRSLSEQLIDQSLDQNVYSPERMTKTGRQEMKVVVSRAEKLSTAHVGRQKLGENANAVFSDPELKAKVGKQEGELVKATYL